MVLSVIPLHLCEGLMNLLERVRISELYYVYSPLLTDRQSKTIDDYVNNNLSLSEIANNLSISRQAVKYTLDSAIEILNKFENRLGFLAKTDKLKTSLKEIVDTTKDKKTREKINKLMEDL